ncbi:MAG: oxygenase MpaB family protein [Chloroflexi bacterium]|nr:oxygenase MpaB family protein [Chloroflexota bacterium]
MDLTVPTDYIEGYALARKANQAVADNYIAHHLIADPEADAVIAELGDMDHAQSAMLIRAAMDDPDGSVLRDSPASLQRLVGGLDNPPDWVNFDEFMPGSRMFLRNARVILAAFVGGTLVEGFTTNISKSFFITGRVRDQGVRRLMQNNRHMLESFLPGGLERTGDGLKLSMRLRLVHAQVRKLLLESDEWDTEAWGVPLSSAHLGMAIAGFSARLLHHMKRLGAKYTDEEKRSFMAVWRYTGYIMGIPETILFPNEEDALELYRIGVMCEPSPSLEGVVMAHALINSAPLVVGIEDPKERQRLASYVFRISRAVIGPDMADRLRYPRTPVLGVLPFFRFQARYHNFLSRWFPRLTKQNNFSQFTGLLDVATVAETEIHYNMPDHVYSENSSPW